MSDLKFPDEPRRPVGKAINGDNPGPKNIVFDDGDLEIERLKANAGGNPDMGALLLVLIFPFYLLDITVVRFFRALWIAYGYVLRGAKVETPYNWSEI